MNRIAEILQELSTLQAQRQQSESLLKDNNDTAQVLTKEWQELCSHSEEYIDKLEDGNLKCCACGFIIKEIE